MRDARGFGMRLLRLLVTALSQSALQRLNGPIDVGPCWIRLIETVSLLTPLLY